MCRAKWRAADVALKWPKTLRRRARVTVLSPSASSSTAAHAVPASDGAPLRVREVMAELEGEANASDADDDDDDDDDVDDGVAALMREHGDDVIAEARLMAEGLKPHPNVLQVRAMPRCVLVVIDVCARTVFRHLLQTVLDCD
jgi:hypothetical protein